MNRDLSGTSTNTSHLVPTTPSSEDSTQLSPYVTSQGAATIDLISYEGTDTMSNVYAAAVLHQKLIDKTVYDAVLNLPTLIQPDPEGQTGPQPYGTAERKFFINHFLNTLKELLKKRGDISDEESQKIAHFLLQGKPLTDARLTNIAKHIEEQAKDETREAAHLPDSWDPKSSSPKDWLPQDIAPYSEEKQSEIYQFYNNALNEAAQKYIAEAKPPLSEVQLKQLNEAVGGGKVDPSISQALRKIIRAATQVTQETYGLPASWSIETKNIKDWKPINLGIVSPGTINQVRAEFIFANLEEFLTDAKQAGEKIATYIKPDNPNQITMNEFRRVITKAIQDLKATLRDIQIKDAEFSKDASIHKQDALDARFERLKEQIDKNKEIEEQKKKAEKIGFAMKIAGPIVAAVSTIVGGALAIFTFGASTALIVAGIAIGTAMTAYAVIDSVTGCTSSLMETINEALKTAFKDDPVMQKFIKTLAVVGIVFILSLIIFASGGSATATVAANAATQFIRETIKQLSIQMVMMVILSSNAIPELVGELVKKHGNPDSSKTWELVAMIITMITVMSAFAVGAKGGIKATAKDIGAGVNAAVTSVQQFATRASEMLKTMIETLKKGMTEAVEMIIKMLKKVLQQLLDSLKNFANQLTEMSEALAKTIKENVKRVKDTVQELLVLLKNPERLKQAPTEALASLAKNFEKAIQDLVESTKNALSKIKETSTSATNAAVEELEASIKSVSEMSAQAMQKLKDAGIQEAHNLWVGFTSIFKFGNIHEGGMAVQKALNLTSQGINIVNGIIQGVCGMKISDLLKQVGYLKESEMLLQAVIALFDKLLKIIQGGMDKRSEFILSLQNAYNSFYDSLSRNTSKIFQG